MSVVNRVLVLGGMGVGVGVAGLGGLLAAGVGAALTSGESAEGGFLLDL